MPTSRETTATAKTRDRASTWRFVRHFVEMLVAMLVGMMALAPLWTLAFRGLGWSAALDRIDVDALVMATNMTLGMGAWMRFRHHAWRDVAEMGAAMYVPFLVLLVPYWAGALSGEAVLAGGHILMIPAMLAVMLLRRDVYSRDHREHRGHRDHAEHAGPASE